MPLIIIKKCFGVGRDQICMHTHFIQMEYVFGSALYQGSKDNNDLNPFTLYHHQYDHIRIQERRDN